MGARRMQGMVVAAACILLLAGCTSAGDVGAAEGQPSGRATEVAQPAATLAPIAAPSDAGAADEPAPQISVQATTQPSGGGGAGGGGSVDAAVTRDSADYASRLVSLANGSRAEAGLAALGVNSCARNAAVARAARALVKAHLEHEPLPDCGSGWTGENLARHYGSAAEMHAAWMGSAGHRANILRPEFTAVGVGCVAYSRSDPQRFATSPSDVGGHVCSEVFVG